MTGGRSFRTVTTTPLAKAVYSLYAVQLATYVLPLVSVPYLIHTLGASQFGVYIFVIAVARFGVLITDWGFNYTATREIVAARLAGRPVGPIYSAVVAGRMLALAVCGVGLGVLMLTTDRFGGDPALYAAAFAGRGRVGVDAALAVPGVRAASGGHECAPGRSRGCDGAAVRVRPGPVGCHRRGGALVDAVRRGRDRRLRRLGALREGALRAAGSAGARRRRSAPGTSMFVTLLFSSVYTSLNAILLGLLSNNKEVGYFGAAETVILAAVGLIGPLAQALFPHAATAGASSPAEAIAHVRRVLPVLAGLGLALGLAVLIVAPLLGPFVLGSSFHSSIATMQIMSPVPLIVALATALATQLMLPLHLDRYYLAAVATGACLSLVLTALLVPDHGAMGTAISVVTTEFAILCGLYGIVRWRGLDPLRRSFRHEVGTP